jgi:glycosyltransferase domain-containing protein
MSTGADLTVLLTLKDRASFTERWMNYANSVAFPFKVVIADGGCDPKIPTILSETNRFPNVDYEYIRYPYDTTYADYYSKIANALGRIRTPFVAMADNDDFYITETMRQAVEFLSANPDYASCGGAGAYFWISPSSATQSDLLYSKNIDWKCNAQARSITAKSARERILTPAPDVNYYDVKRTDHAREQFALVCELNLHDLFLVEYAIQFLTAIAGKTKRLDRMYIARQYNTPNSSGVAHAEEYGGWFGRMLLESWSGDFSKFVNALAVRLAEADNISVNEARGYVIRAYRMLIAPSLLSDILEEPTVTTSMPVVATITKYVVRLPRDSIVRKIMQRIYRTLRWVSINSVYGETVFVRPVSNSKRDFRGIMKFLACSRA